MTKCVELQEIRLNCIRFSPPHGKMCCPDFKGSEKRWRCIGGLPFPLRWRPRSNRPITKGERMWLFTQKLKECLLLWNMTTLKWNDYSWKVWKAFWECVWGIRCLPGRWLMGCDMCVCVCPFAFAQPCLFNPLRTGGRPLPPHITGQVKPTLGQFAEDCFLEYSEQVGYLYL